VKNAENTINAFTRSFFSMLFPQIQIARPKADAVAITSPRRARSSINNKKKLDWPAMIDELNRILTKHEQLALLIGILAAEVHGWIVGILGESLFLILVFIPIGALLFTDKVRIQQAVNDPNNPK